VLLAEEVVKRGMNLRGVVVTYVSDIICQRAAVGERGAGS
jgi:hypothetical protein